MKRNEVVNYPIQGTAFHVNLKSIIKIQREIERRKMKTLLIGQIHDSLLADVPENEFDMFVEIATNIMRKEIRKEYEWIIVPIDVEVEATPINGTWYEKKKIEIVAA
jgi:DNA polymerase-1